MPHPELRAAKVAIVDDQEANTDLLEMFLRDDGYENLSIHRDPRAFLVEFATLHPDIILLDLHMPHLDGFAVMDALREQLGGDVYLPILVLTSDVTEEVKRRALAGGAKDFLTKPLDEIEVLLRIRNLLETRLLHRDLQERNRELESTVLDLEKERALSERLLLNVLPRTVAERLRREASILADSFDEATVLFADLAGFSEMCAQTPPEQLVQWLNALFTCFDRLVAESGLEKIKTIGDAYMVAGGLPEAMLDHAERVATLALALQRETAAHQTPTGEPLRLRIGMHTGRVVAGVLGTHRFAYDLWGETVNTASRMESLGEPGRIQITESMAERLRGRFECEERGVVTVKGHGPVKTFFLIRERDFIIPIVTGCAGV